MVVVLVGKKPAHLVGMGIQRRPRVWKRLRQVEHSLLSIPDHKRRRNDQGDEGLDPAQIRTGGGCFPGFLAGPRLQLCMCSN